MTAPRTAWQIGEQSASKPLAPFGSASIAKPISKAIAKANADDRNPTPIIE